MDLHKFIVTLIKYIYVHYRYIIIHLPYDDCTAQQHFQYCSQKYIAYKRAISLYARSAQDLRPHEAPLYLTLSFSHTLTLSHFLSSCSGSWPRNTGFMYKKDFSARVAGRAKKRKEHATRKYDITRSRNCSRRCSLLKLFLSNFLTQLPRRIELTLDRSKVQEKIHRKCGIKFLRTIFLFREIPC